MFRVLHVDMSQTFRHVTAQVIEEIGGRYTGVSGSSAALDFLKEHAGEVELIITGVELEDVAAEEMIRKFNASDFSDIPVIVISATDSLEAKKQYFQLGVIDFIPKSDMVHQKLRRYLNVYLENQDLHEQINSLNVAVVDDSKASLQVIRKVFQANRLDNVDYFTDTKSLFASGKQYTVYILDMILPEVSGRELILRLREQDPNSVIIAVSGMGDYKTISNVLTIGANDYLIKPFNADIFISRLKSNVRSMLLYKELEEARDRLKNLSERDGLTGLYNHMAILNHLKGQVSGGGVFSILLFDVDNFKAVNDTYGHQVGDDVLSCIAAKLKEMEADLDYSGRFGGEEFLLIWPGVELEEAKKRAITVLKDVRTCGYSEKNLSITISGGICVASSSSAEELVSIADKRLYFAKSTGKNRVFYNDTDAVE